VTAAGDGAIGDGDVTAAGDGATGVDMTTPTIIPMMTKITITITATGGPLLGALTTGAAPEFIYNLNSEINSSKFL